MNERGVTLVELLVAMAIGSVILLLGLGSLHVFTGNYVRQDERLTYLQRQGTLVLEEMGRRIRQSNAMKCSPAACDPLGSSALATCGVDPSLQVTNAVTDEPGDHCFRLDAAGGDQLIEVRPSGGQTNLLKGAPATLTVSACPGISMFSVVSPDTNPACSPTCAPPNRAEICFQLSTASPAPDSMIFKASFTLRN